MPFADPIAVGVHHQRHVNVSIAIVIGIDVDQQVRLAVMVEVRVVAVEVGVALRRRRRITRFGVSGDLMGWNLTVAGVQERGPIEVIADRQIMLGVTDHTVQSAIDDIFGVDHRLAPC